MCERCGYSTNHKSVFSKHIRRKNICKPIISDVDITINYDKYNIVPFGSKTVPFGSKTVPFGSKNEKTVPFLEPFFGTNTIKEKSQKNIISCMYCQKIYSRIGNLNKHYKICKKKKKENETTSQLEIVKLENDKLKEKIEKLENSIINTHTNTQINTQINTNTQINIGSISNNIIINNYGDEDISYIKGNDLTKCVKNMPPGVLKLIEKIHFNPKHPENTNLRITNKKEQFIQVRRKNKWLLEDKCETINNLLTDKYQLLEEHLSQLDKSLLTKKDLRIIDRFRTNYEDNVTYVKDLLKKIELLILNNSK